MKPKRQTRRKFLQGIASGVILVGGAAMLPGRAEAQAKGAAAAGGAKGAAAAAAGGAKGAAAAAAGGAAAAAAGGAAAAAGGAAAAAAGGGGSIPVSDGSGESAVQDIPFGAEGVIVAAILGYGVYRIRKEARKIGPGGAAAAAAG